MINREKVTSKFIDMVKISSPSLKEREMGDYLLKTLNDLGLEVYEDNAGKENGGNCGNIVGILKAPNKKKVLFSSHMDTVLPCEKVTPVMDLVTLVGLPLLLHGKLYNCAAVVSGGRWVLCPKPICQTTLSFTKSGILCPAAPR